MDRKIDEDMKVTNDEFINWLTNKGIKCVCGHGDFQAGTSEDYQLVQPYSYQAGSYYEAHGDEKSFFGLEQSFFVSFLAICKSCYRISSFPGILVIMEIRNAR